jgi:hypothetical protein
VSSATEKLTSEPLPILDRLLSDFAATEENFEVLLPKGHRLPFRYIKNYSEFQAAKRLAAIFGSRFTADKRKKLPGDFKKYADVTSPETAAQCAFLAHICTDPELKTEIAWLRIADEASMLFATIVERIDDHYGNDQTQQELEEIEESKNS